jgi:hypothetical protein
MTAGSVYGADDLLEVKVPLVCPSTEGVPAHREGRYSQEPSDLVVTKAVLSHLQMQIRWSARYVALSSKFLCHILYGVFLALCREF